MLPYSSIQPGPYRSHCTEMDESMAQQKQGTWAGRSLDGLGGGERELVGPMTDIAPLMAMSGRMELVSPK